MIRIRHSGKPYEELELQGSSADLSELRAGILSFCESAQPTVDLPARSAFGSSPHQRGLERLRLCKTGDLLLISVAEGQLLISGKPEFLRLFANQLPSGALAPAGAPARVHFDLLGPAARISEAALDIVLTAES